MTKDQMEQEQIRKSYFRYVFTLFRPSHAEELKQDRARFLPRDIFQVCDAPRQIRPVSEDHSNRPAQKGPEAIHPKSEPLDAEEEGAEVANGDRRPTSLRRSALPILQLWEARPVEADREDPGHKHHMLQH